MKVTKLKAVSAVSLWSAEQAVGAVGSAAVKFNTGTEI